MGYWDNCEGQPNNFNCQVVDKGIKYSWILKIFRGIECDQI